MSIHTLTIHAATGKFSTGTGFITNTEFQLPVKGKFVQETITKHLVTELAIATEEKVKKLGGTVGWGAAGVLLLGPVGLLAGLLLGGRATRTVFTMRFLDGSAILASGNSQAYIQAQSLFMTGQADRAALGL